MYLFIQYILWYLNIWHKQTATYFLIGILLSTAIKNNRGYPHTKDTKHAHVFQKK